jgi:pimeloyl-ACP methyl ester carboxylesterase
MGITMIGSGLVRGQDDGAAADSATGYWNLRLKTAGGKQLWTDVWLEPAFHIQRHALTGHYRLLDERNVRWAWGSWEACRQAVGKLRDERAIEPVRGPVVILLHGLARSHSAMEKLAGALRAGGQYTVLNMQYASTRADVNEHAAALASVIDHLPEATEINLVGHSLGSIVIRAYFSAAPDGSAAWQVDRRIGRVVMLAPPNQGAQMAERFGRNVVFEWTTGPSGKLLARYWQEFGNGLGPPPCEFGIIAGGTGTPDGFNPLIDGDDDLVLAVDETRLDGASDFLVVPSIHTYIMDKPVVHEAVLSFLQSGRFAAAPSAELNDLPPRPR